MFTVNYIGIILFSLLICSLLFLKTVFLKHSVSKITVQYELKTCCCELLLFYFQQSLLYHLLMFEPLLVQWSQFASSSSYSLSMSLLPSLCLWLTKGAAILSTSCTKKRSKATLHDCTQGYQVCLQSNILCYFKYMYVHFQPHTIDPLYNGSLPRA